MTDHQQTLLSGSHAVVTGGARGIGAAVTRILAAHGAKVTMLGRSTAPHGDLAGNPQLQYVQADVSKPATLPGAFAAARAGFGAIHILVNNAGQARSASLPSYSGTSWKLVRLTVSTFCTAQRKRK